MKKILLMLFLPLFVIISCSSKPEYKTPEAVVKASTKYLNEENIESFMTTILTRSPYYHDIETNTKKTFEMYDLKYKIENIKVLEQSKGEAKVEFTQVTTKIKGPDFKNNKTTGVHILQKEGDSWKIYSTEMVDVVFLDQKDPHN